MTRTHVSGNFQFPGQKRYLAVEFAVDDGEEVCRCSRERALGVHVFLSYSTG